MLETVIRFYGWLYDRLHYLRPSVHSLMEQAANSPEFERLSFISRCFADLRQGRSFPESWKSAVHEDDTVIDNDVSHIIENLSNTLGTADLESQLSAIAYDKSRLEQRLMEARSYAEKHRKLYQMLGVLSGLGLAVFVA